MVSPSLGTVPWVSVLVTKKVIRKYQNVVLDTRWSQNDTKFDIRTLFEVENLKDLVLCDFVVMCSCAP